ncbi:MAG: AraC family transcriptional regulator [Clostridiaceae bacterium]|nr:AraC family transcriptional regulator [Clostridiaceae bacterium]
MILSDLVPYLRYYVDRHCPAQAWQVGPRTIPDHELVLITAGQGQIVVDGKSGLVQAGRLLYFQPGLQHTLKSDPNRPLVFHALHFSYTRVSYSHGQWTIGQDDTPLPVPTIQDCVRSQHLDRLFCAIGRHWSESPVGNSLACRGLFLQLLHQVIAGSSGRPAGSQHAVAAILATRDTIDVQFASRLSVRELAGQAGLSVDYFTRLFRQVTSMTPQDYICHVRIAKARELLLDPAAKVREVALRVGYPDEFYFSRLFKKQVGISPQAFQNLSDRT